MLGLYKCTTLSGLDFPCIYKRQYRVPSWGQKKLDEGWRWWQMASIRQHSRPSLFLVFGIKEPVLWAQLGRQTFPGKCKLPGGGRDGFEIIWESLQQDQGPLRPSRQQQQRGLKVGIAQRSLAAWRNLDSIPRAVGSHQGCGCRRYNPTPNN